MQIVITMAGLGTRFKKAGYKEPKYQIKAFDRSLFAWSMESLAGFAAPSNQYYFIVRAEDQAADFIKQVCTDEKICDPSAVHVIEISYMTDGQATTALLAAPYWDKDDELLIYNIDTYVEKYAMKREDISGDGFIPCFYAEGDHWSFVKLSPSGDAEEVREKVRISDHCTLGAYYFKTCGLYEQIYKEYYNGNTVLDAGERYVAPMYNYMIEKGYCVRICDVDAAAVHVLGTPEELQEFICRKD